MPIASLVLGGVAFLFMIGGFFLTAVPIAGSILSFGAPLLSLTGIVLGGMAMSRAKQEGGTNGVALAGLILNIVAFLLSLAVALTCGLCNACLTAGEMNRQNNPSGTSPGDALGQQLGQSLAANMNRISVSMKLSAIKMSCTSDPSGAGAMQQFHPSVAGQYQAVACQVDQPLVDAIGRGCSDGVRPCSEAAVVAGTADASRVTALGLDANQCYSYVSGTAKVIGCRDAASNQFQLVHLENPTGVM
ncbi:MAG: DUF4190 domain-containing protein [Deltaproteobacteria bacterium]|nr:DUF4190 domain-containing protein [Deltaproteobacteria bacterium]